MRWNEGKEECLQDEFAYVLSKLESMEASIFYKPTIPCFA
jgi:hypothetical protein